MRKSLIISLALAAAVIAAVVIYQLRSMRAGTPVRILYTADLLGNMEEIEKQGVPLGGVARRLTLVERLKNPHTVIADVGDFSPARHPRQKVYSVAIVRHIIKGMEASGVQVANIGFTEQQLGRETLSELLAESDIPFVSASIVDPVTDEYVFEPFHVMEVNGVAIAFVGVLDLAPIRELQDMKEHFAGLNIRPDAMVKLLEMVEEGEGLRLLSVDAALARVTPLLKGRADMAVILASADASLWRNMLPYRDAALYKLALAGSPFPLDEARFHGDVPVMINGDGGTHVGVVDFLYRAERPVRLTRWQAVPVTRDIPPHERLAGLIRQMRASLGAINPAILIEKDEPDGRQRFVGAEACAACHRQEYDIWRASPHVHTLETLKAEDAQFDPACLACHVTGLSATDGYFSEEATPLFASVSCEACHQRASEHVASGGRGPEARLFNIGPPMCVSCHDAKNSPGFDYRTYWPRIRHGRGRTPEPAAAASDAPVATGAPAAQAPDNSEPEARP